jgi:hypothetical protein
VVIIVNQYLPKVPKVHRCKIRSCVKDHKCDDLSRRCAGKSAMICCHAAVIRNTIVPAAWQQAPVPQCVLNSAGGPAAGRGSTTGVPVGVTGKRCWVMPSFRPLEVVVYTCSGPPHRAVSNYTLMLHDTRLCGSGQHRCVPRPPECKTRRASCAIFLVPFCSGRSGRLSKVPNLWIAERVFCRQQRRGCCCRCNTAEYLLPHTNAGAISRVVQQRGQPLSAAADIGRGPKAEVEASLGEVLHLCRVTCPRDCLVPGRVLCHLRVWRSGLYHGRRHASVHSASDWSRHCVASVSPHAPAAFVQPGITISKVKWVDAHP